MAKLEECGLEASIDGIGNVLGRHRGPDPTSWSAAISRPRTRPAGSTGRWAWWPGLALPGPAAGRRRRLRGEEGHFSGGFLGSRSAIGDLTEAEIEAAPQPHRRHAAARALEAAGLAGLPRMRLDPARYRGFLELHIEQGTQLESAGLHLGVVSGIVAIWQFQIVFDGNQDHAGGTTMAERRMRGSRRYACSRRSTGNSRNSAARAAPGPPAGSPWIPAATASSRPRRGGLPVSATCRSRCWSA